MRPVRYKAWWGGSIAVVVLIGAAYGFAPDPPRLILLDSAQAQHRVLKDIDAETYAPAEYEDYIRALESARAELVRQRSLFYYSRQYLTFQRFCQDAIESSGRAERAARENRLSTQSEVFRRSQEVRYKLSDVRSRLNRVGLSNTNRGRLIRADVLLREAEILSKSQDWNEAIERVSSALTCVQGAQAEQTNRMSRFQDPEQVRQWDRWVRETVAWSAQYNTRAVVVVKTRNICLLLDDGRLVRSYEADLGKNSVYDKSYRGDYATPEGKYKIIKKKGRGQSKYYKALLINYPNEDDIRLFRRYRRIGVLHERSRLGGLIEIHGDGGRDKNWTEGCVALENGDMDDLFSRVDVGTPVTIVGHWSEMDRRQLVSN